jgi:hypothetical protein
MGKIPESYQSAKWRNTLPVDVEGKVGVGFDLGDGDIIRVRLSIACARHLAASLEGYLAQSQSATDGGMPKHVRRVKTRPTGLEKALWPLMVMFMQPLL